MAWTQYEMRKYPGKYWEGRILGKRGRSKPRIFLKQAHRNVYTQMWLGITRAARDRQYLSGEEIACIITRQC